MSRCQCLVAVGCNRGDCETSIQNAIDRINALPQTSVLESSSLLETAPVGNVQGKFLNGALRISTELEPAELMRKLLSIERTGGRDRQQDAGNRPIDLDILLFDQRVIETELLTVPHPRMSFRRFVLQPAAEIAPDWIHPELNLTLGRLYEKICDPLNLIAVLRPNDGQESVKTKDVSAWDQANVRWISMDTNAGHAAASLAINPFPVESDPIRSESHEPKKQTSWLVLVTTDAEQLAQVAKSIKLLMNVGHSNRQAGQTANPVHLFECPRWDLPELTDLQLRSNVLTAIASMKSMDSDEDPG